MIPAEHCARNLTEETFEILEPIENRNRYFEILGIILRNIVIGLTNHY